MFEYFVTIYWNGIKIISEKKKFYEKSFQNWSKIGYFCIIRHLLISVISTLCYFWLLKRTIIFDSMINSEWCLGTILKRSNLFTFFFFTHAPKWSICYLASWSLGCNCNPRTLESEHWVCTSLIFLQNYLCLLSKKICRQNSIKKVQLLIEIHRLQSL